MTELEKKLYRETCNIYSSGIANKNIVYKV